MEIKAVRGMHDLYGDEMVLWSHVETRVRKILAAYGYTEIRTPVLEKKEVFSQAVGDQTDIVEKQMYQVVTESETMVLRPEGTAGFMRAVVEHQLHRLGYPQRFYYYLPMFRHERPQKGRLRQFHQFGCELILDPSPEADVEIIAILDQIYKAFDITAYEIRVNSVGCSDCRPVYKEKLKAYFKPHFDTLCEQCRGRFERAPMRILDCKKEACIALGKNAPLIVDSLCEPCRTHHTNFRKGLELAGITYIDDPYIVRGLDYYCRTAFEFTSNLLGAQSALCGGGRYDGISERFGEKAFPGVGFGLGMERLMMVVEEKLKATVKKPAPTYYLAALGDQAFDRLFALAQKLRVNGIPVAMNYDRQKGLKSLLKEANRLQSAYVVILGEDEMKRGEATLKDMVKSTQENLNLNNLEQELARRMPVAP